MKIRYTELDEAISSKSFLTYNDKVNVFINLESIYKNISMIQDLEQKIFLQKDFKEIIISNILNLAAHYKHFFISNNIDVRIYLYQTDLRSDDFKQRRYNEDFRTYYLVKYNQNPKFTYFTDFLKNEILEELKIYCEFIPRVYFINSHNIEGSAIPSVVQSDDTTRKNIIIGNDVFDSQYSFQKDFMCFFIQKGYGRSIMFNDQMEYITAIMKKPKEEVLQECPFFNNFGMYVSLLSVMGNRIRSIDGIGGIGPNKLSTNMRKMIQTNHLNQTSNNPVMIGEFLSSNSGLYNQFINNYNCTSVLRLVEDISDSERLSLLSQRKDRLDINSLMALNNTTFKKHPLLLDALSH